MRLTNRKTHFTERIPLLVIRSIRTDRQMAFTDRYGAGDALSHVVILLVHALNRV